VARSQSRYVCQACGAAQLRWEGQCRDCGGWNTLVETVVRAETRKRAVAGPATGAEALAGAGADEGAPRRPLGIGELDRVLGGGIVAGSVILLGGEPGIGKSTLLLQVAAAVAAAPDGGHVLYASGEESAGQLRLRAARLGILDGAAGRAIRVVAERDIGRVVELARSDLPGLLIVDSIQTAVVEELDGPPGSVGQVRESAARLGELAKATGTSVVLVGHVTKDGTLAGPKTLEHLVDVVLGLEGERSGGLRLLRSPKNRYGSTEEVGVFEMLEEGLVEVPDPARAFLGEHPEPAPGSVVGATLEGTRPILVEVQALTAAGAVGTPRRTTSGLDPNRLALLIAVLGRRAGIGLSGHDVYANLAGGLAFDDPALDLPLCLALASSLRDAAVSPGTIAIGEVGLLGELRGVPGLERRLREARRLGFERAVVPAAAGRRVAEAPPGLTVAPAATLAEALRTVLDGTGPTQATRRRDR
jgi:DNA repair protein RadA/Sms